MQEGQKTVVQPLGTNMRPPYLVPIWNCKIIHSPAMMILLARLKVYLTVLSQILHPHQLLLALKQKMKTLRIQAIITLLAAQTMMFICQLTG